MALKDKFQILLLLTSISLLSNCTAQPTALIPASNTIDITEETTSPTLVPTDFHEPIITPTQLQVNALLEINKKVVGELTLLKSFSEDGAHIAAWTLSNDGTLLAVAFSDETLFMWNLPSLEPQQHPFKRPADNFVFFSVLHDEILIAKSIKNNLEITDLFTDELQNRVQGQFFYSGFPIPGTGNMVATLSPDVILSRKIELWELSIPGRKVQGFRREWLPDDPLFKSFSLAFFSPDGTLLAAALNDWKTSTVWDVESGDIVHEFSNAHVGTFSHSGTMLATQVEECQIAIFDTMTWKQIAILNNDNVRVRSLVFSNDDKLIITYADDGTIAVWDWASGTKLRTLIAYTPPSVNLNEGPDGVIRGGSFSDILLSPDGKLLVSYNGFTDEIQFWGVPQ